MSVDFLLQLCAYNGPEFYGLIPFDKEKDLSK